jgi:hypothetical protein
MTTQHYLNTSGRAHRKAVAEGKVEPRRRQRYNPEAIRYGAKPGDRTGAWEQIYSLNQLMSY